VIGWTPILLPGESVIRPYIDDIEHVDGPVQHAISRQLTADG
jgi:hypothetical protein